MDPARLALFRSLAPLELIEVAGASVLAAAHPGLAPAGSLSHPTGEPRIGRMNSPWAVHEGTRVYR